MTHETEMPRDESRRRQIAALVVILLLLLLLLVAVAGFIWRFASPPTANKNDIDTGSPGMTWVRSIYGWGSGQDQRLTYPTDVAIGPDGVIWTNDEQNARVLGFAPDGTLRHVIGEKEGALLSDPVSVSESEDNEVYVADLAAGHIFVFNREGALLRSWRVASPRDVEVIGDRVYVCATGAVGVFTPEGEMLFSVGTEGGGPEEFESPQSVAEDVEGNFYVVDTINSRIKAYTPEGELRWIFPSYAENVIREDRKSLAGPASTDASGNAEFDLPIGGVVDDAGRLLVVDAFAFSIDALSITDEAAVLGRHGEQGRDDGKLWYPSDIAFDSARNWVAVADTDNNRIQLFEIDGTAGNSALAEVRRGDYGPVWVCSIPLAGLLLLGLLAALGRRRQRADDVSTVTYEET